MLNWFKKKRTGSMTLIEADHILDILSAALQEDNGTNYHPISSLEGYDVFQVDTALKLCIANDFLVFTANGLLDEFEKRCREWGSTPMLVLTLFVADAELDKLKTLPKGSREYLQAQIEISPGPVDKYGFRDPKFNALETLSSFGDYCKHIGAEDPIYWQKIYTRIGLPYDGGAPRGNYPT